MSRPDRHAPYRELLARQMDEALAPAERTDLKNHLAACGPCRAVAQTYTAERSLLQGLRASDPPRDLWARTSTALDLEVGRAAHRPRLIALGSLASLGLVLAVAAGGAGLGPFSQDRPGAATPFPVTPQPVAFVTSQGNEITIYQTQVDEVCPAAVVDCGGPDPSASPVISIDLTAEYVPRDLSLGADGNLAITASDGRGNALYSVLALPGDQSAGSSASPLATGAIRPTPSSSPAAPSDKGHTAPPTHRASRTPVPTIARTSPPTGIASSSGSPAASDETGSGVQLEPILSDVTAAGAPAAWSPDGATLAFSAAPADSSAGPDIYVWHVGDTTAHALTRDHRSYFASWAGDRIVVSRLPAQPPSAQTGASDRAGRITAAPLPGTVDTPPAAAAAATYLLDPTTGAATLVPLPAAWLPSVDPTGRVAIFWRAGGLYLTDWAALTGIPPTVPTAAAVTGPDASDGPSLGASSSTATTNRASPTPTAATAPSASFGDPQADRTPRPSAGSGGSPHTSAQATVSPTADTSPVTATTPIASDTPASALRLLVAAGTGVTDWLVRWTPDGQAYGVWTSNDPGADVGILLVANAAPTTAEDPLGPTPAMRAFSLGEGRVAWITPEGGGDGGDLRIVTWGADGAGGARIRVGAGATLAF